LKHSRKKFWLSWLRLFTCFLWLRVKCDCPSLAQLCTLVTKDRVDTHFVCVLQITDVGIYLFIYLFGQYWGLTLGSYHWRHILSPFCFKLFSDRI
jgi:hypothetical protein